MRRILFVDDEENVLQGLKVMLHRMRGSCEMVFAQGGAAAVEILEASEPFEIVISDMHMPGMHGAELLGKVMEISPETVRIVLSGNLDSETLVKSSSVAHQVISKPCDPHHLRGILLRALSLHDQLDQCTLKEALMEMGSLPSVPVIYWEVMNEINAPEPSIERVGRIIEKDPGMSAKVLQIANVHAGGERRISNIREAASVLGLENVKSFVLMAEIFSQYEDKETPEDFNLDELWQHGLTVGQYAKTIAEFEVEDKKIHDDAYTAGLLHDIGLLIIASKLPDHFNQAMAHAKEKKIWLQQAEKDLFGASHAQIGGYLLDLWGLPDTVVNAISHHFYPSGSPDEGYEEYDVPEFSPLTAVHVANYFCEDAQAGEIDYAAAQIDSVHLDRLQLTERMGTWWDMCLRFNK